MWLVLAFFISGLISAPFSPRGGGLGSGLGAGLGDGLDRGVGGCYGSGH